MERRSEAKRELSDETDNSLQMAPELMLELARKKLVSLLERSARMG